MELKPSDAFLAGLQAAGAVRVTTVSSLASLLRRFVTEEAALRRELEVCLLIWESPPKAPSDEVLLASVAGSVNDAPKPGEPQVFWLRKSGNKHNGFPMGVTFGNAENNDLCIAHASVSAFHGYFLQERSGHWKVVDAESKGGVWLGAQRLPANHPTLVPDGARLKIGEVELIFHEPEAFLKYLQRQLDF